MKNRYPDQVLVGLGKCLGSLRKAGMPDNFYDKVTNDKAFRSWLVEQCSEKLGTKIVEPESQQAARAIMGRNMLGLPEVARHFDGLSKEQITALAEIPFSEEVLREYAKTHVLVADIGLSILDVRGKSGKGLFCWQEWFSDEEFAKETDEVCWRLIRKMPVENSTSKSWSDQQKLISDRDEVPSARVVVCMVVLHFLATDERLFEPLYVRTSSVSSDGLQVDIGYFDEDGLGINDWNVNDRYYYLGVASSRRLGPEVEA